MTSVVAEFEGGPSDGLVIQLQEMPQWYYFPIMTGASVLDDPDPMRPVPVQQAEYERVAAAAGDLQRGVAARCRYRFKGYRSR